MKDKIIKMSKDLNIDLIGFCNSDILSNRENYLFERKIQGNFTEFEEQDINKKINPKLSFMNTKTIIVIGLNYFSYKNDEKIPPNHGKLSRSSWGKDYHLVLKEKIESLIAQMKKLTSFNYKYFIDTGPLMERELANKAGLGYYGKNCSIINETYGSYIFLGHILTDLEIEVAEPINSTCGSCRKCIDACPTGALYEPFKVNPKKCISYLTQTKEPLKIEDFKKIGKQIYGCDICQNVCPKNLNIPETKHKDFKPIFTTIDLMELFNMSNREFRNKYKIIAASWRGKNILIRNGKIILGENPYKKID